ncbi:MAG: GumC family protein [Hyphomicrobium sp.]
MNSDHRRSAMSSPRRFASNEEADLTGLIAILRRNLWKIVLSTLAGLTLALAYLALATPLYTATASLFVDPRTRKVVSEEVVQGGFGSDLALVESQVSIITSDAVLKRVVDTMDLTTDMEYAPPQGQGLLSRLKGLIITRNAAPDPTVQALMSLAHTIKVKRAQKTYVVDVEVTASNPVKAARIAAALVDAYLADQTAAKAAEAKRANALIDARLGELRDQVRRAEIRVDDFKKQSRILTSEGGVVTEQQLSKVNGELISARAAAAEARARHEQIVAALKTGAGPESLPDAVRSGLVQKLREQYAQVARREAALSSQLQPRHPILIEVRSQLAEVKSQIASELKRVAAAAQSEYQIASSREKGISEQLDRAKAEVTISNTAQIKLRELEQEVTASRELLKLFLARAKETQEQQNVSTPDARVITQPSVPTKPSKPMTWLVLGLGLLGGLGIGLASALVLDHLDRSVRKPSDLASIAGLQTLAALPVLGRPASFLGSRRRTTSSENVEAVQFSELLSALADSAGQDDGHYRQAVLRLLGKIKSQQRPGRPHAVMMLSPSKGAGNSATTLAVAYAAALAGDRVLLVDATSSDPELSLIFAQNLKPTNVVILDNKDHLARITTKDARSGLTFLPIALADLRTLKSQQRRRLVAGLNGLSQNFDLVFIDAGSVLDDEAATALLPVADQIALVVRSGVTTRGEIAETLELIDSARDRVSGAVMTLANA